MSLSASVAVHPSEGIYSYRGQFPQRPVFSSLARSSASSMTTSSSSCSSSHIRNRSVGFSVHSDHGLALPNPKTSPSQARAFVKPAPSSHSMVSKVSAKIDDGNPGSRHGRSNGEERYHDDNDVAAQRLWYKLVDHRRTIRRLRKDIITQRKSLRSMRKELAEADNTFMNSLRKGVYSSWASSGLGEDVVIAQFKTIQDLRTRNGTIEATLYQLEDDLEMEEQASEQTEDAFFRHIYQDSALGSESDGGGGSASANPTPFDRNEDRPLSRTSLLGIPPDRPVDLHPTYTKLLSAVADKNEAIEIHEDIMDQRDAILQDIETRRKIDRRRNFEIVPVTEEELDELKSDLANIAEIDRFLQKHSIEIDDDDLEFLKSYPDSEKEARESVESTTVEVERLWSLCIKHGVMHKHPSLSQDYIIRKSLGKPTDHLHMDIDLEPSGPQQPGKRSLAHPIFNILLSDPAHVLDCKSARTALEDAMDRLRERASPEAAQEVQRCKKEVAIESLITEHEDKTQMINNWILHQLRTTPLEVRRLLNTFSLTTGLRVKDFAWWQNDVLHSWDHDELARLPPSALDGPLTSVDSLDLNLKRQGDTNRGESRVNSAVNPNPSARSQEEDTQWVKSSPAPQSSLCVPLFCIFCFAMYFLAMSFYPESAVLAFSIPCYPFSSLNRLNYPYPILGLDTPAI
ncbi:hypothetical protein GGTG_10499 [Gaeumannomyces tritici R3-111a-1]|uniref:Uncharacterized protein n=1 Tax=Gaeumannomyces tritici (strain R3-111a-1) TaxID=644352 RepID=J3PAH3_GAET3|nr:hypothetical protein GGTG_10499 [Gaeumannomyces tritici R3-111a-1]EJT71239.1 hypothetical protein GGTG_10499 [Gaeumannomyces tritici R3-111a-1]